VLFGHYRFLSVLILIALSLMNFFASLLLETNHD
jgi:hypothetical protein